LILPLSLLKILGLQSAWNGRPNIKKRIILCIGIIKDIEKHQTKPTTGYARTLILKSHHKENAGQAPLLMGGQSNNPEKGYVLKSGKKAIEIEKEFIQLKRD